MTMGMSELVSVTSVLVVGAMSLLAYWLWRSQQVYKMFEKLGIPGPAPSYFLGNTRQMTKTGMCTSFIQWQQKYGKCYGIYMAGIPCLVVADLDMLRDLMVKKFSQFSNRMPQKIMEFKPWKDNLLQLRDDHWKHVRSQLSPTFSSGKLKKMIPAIDRVIRNLDKHVMQKAREGKEVELKELAGCFAMDTIAGAAFGLQVDTLTNPDEPFYVNGMNLFKQNKWLFMLLLTFPKLGPLLHRFGLNFISGKATNFFLSVLNASLKDRRVDKKTYSDFLQLLVEAQKEGQSQDHAQGPVDAEIDHSAHLTTSKTWSRKGMNDDELIANALIFLLAGYDTTATVLSFTLFHLAANPQCLLKAQQEVDDKLGQAAVTYDTASDLTYLDMCMNEGMRLFPPGFILDREAAEDMELGGYQVKKGMRMIIPAFAIHRDPEYWPDPDKFDPERHTVEARAERHPFAFLPFGMGPRNCIGMRLAQLEVRMALATVLQRAVPVLCDKSVYPPVLKSPEGRMVSKDGLWIKFTPRD